MQHAPHPLCLAGALLAPHDLGRELAAGIPDAHFVPLESRNHILMDTEPAWLHCVQASAAFLAEHRI